MLKHGTSAGLNVGVMGTKYATATDGALNTGNQANDGSIRYPADGTRVSTWTSVVTTAIT